MSKDDQPVTSGDFKLLIEEIKKVNASVKNIPAQKGGAVNSIASSIKERFEGIKKNLRNPFEVVTEAVQAPFQAVSGAVESVGEAVMQPFQAFKDVTQGFKNIFSKNTTEKQTELLEQILESIDNLNDKFKSDLNRERNQDLTKLEQTKEQAGVFKSIASNIKKSTLDGTGRGVKRKGKPGTGAAGGLGVNILSDFFLAATVSQRGIGDFLKTTGKNLKSATKSLLKVPGALLGGARRFLGRRILSPIKNLFTDVKDREQGQFPLRRQAIKDTLKKPFVAVKQAGQRLKERFFPTPEVEQEEFNLTGVAEEKKRKTRSDKGIKRGSYLEKAQIRKDQEGQQMKFDFPVFDLILRTNQEIVKSSKENTSQLIDAITGKGEVIDVDAEVINGTDNLQLESATGEEKGFRRTRSDKGIPRGSYDEARGEKVLNQLEENEQQQELQLSGTDLIVRSNQEIVKAVKANTISIIKTITGNDLRKAETEKERDKTFSDIADSLENLEDGGGLMSKDGQAGQAGGGDGFLDNILQFFGVKGLLGNKGKPGGKPKGKPGMLGRLGGFLGGKFKGIGALGKGLITGTGALLTGSLFTGGGDEKPKTTSKPKVDAKPKPGLVSSIKDSGKSAISFVKDKATQGKEFVKNKIAETAAKQKKPSLLGRIKDAGSAALTKAKDVGGAALKALNPMDKIKTAVKGVGKAFPSLLKKVPIIGGVVEGIFLNSEINRILEDPQASEEDKKRAVGSEFIKAFTGPAGAALAIGLVTAATGGIGILGSLATGTAGYAMGKVVGDLLSTVLPVESIGGAIINTFYEKKAGFGDEEAISQTTNPVTEITSDAKENRFAASRVAVKDAEAALAKFESENQGAEMIEVQDPDAMFDEDSTYMAYKDPEKQAQVEKLRSNVYDATKERSIASRNVMGLPDYKSQETIGDDLKTIDFIQDRFGINFPGYSESVDGTSAQYIGSGAAIQAAQELFEKNPNATGAEMLQAIQGGNDAASEMRASMNAAMGQSQNPGIVNAPTNNVQNNSSTIINEAAKHIDRTTQLFGPGGSYQSIPSLDF